jgi:hypothetical protein
VTAVHEALVNAPSCVPENVAINKKKKNENKNYSQK